MNCQTNKMMKLLINAQHLRLYHDPRPLRRQKDPVQNDAVTEPDTKTQQEDMQVENYQQIPNV